MFRGRARPRGRSDQILQRRRRGDAAPRGFPKRIRRVERRGQVILIVRRRVALATQSRSKPSASILSDVALVQRGVRLFRREIRVVHPRRLLGDRFGRVHRNRRANSRANVRQSEFAIFRVARARHRLLERRRRLSLHSLLRRGRRRSTFSSRVFRGVRLKHLVTRRRGRSGRRARGVHTVAIDPGAVGVAVLARSTARTVARNAAPSGIEPGAVAVAVFARCVGFLLRDVRHHRRGGPLEEEVGALAHEEFEYGQGLRGVAGRRGVRGARRRGEDGIRRVGFGFALSAEELRDEGSKDGVVGGRERSRVRGVLLAVRGGFGGFGGV